MFLRTNCRSWKVQQSLLGDNLLALHSLAESLLPLVNGRAQGSVGRVEKGKVTDSLSLHIKRRREEGEIGESLSLLLMGGVGGRGHDRGSLGGGTQPWRERRVEREHAATWHGGGGGGGRSGIEWRRGGVGRGRSKHVITVIQRCVASASAALSPASFSRGLHCVATWSRCRGGGAQADIHQTGHNFPSSGESFAVTGDETVLLSLPRETEEGNVARWLP